MGEIPGDQYPSRPGMDKNPATASSRESPAPVYRRADVRVSLDLPLGILRMASDRGACRNEKLVLVRAVDISAGGISFISPQEIFVNDSFMIRSSLPQLNLNGLRLKIVGRSMHLGAPKTLCHCRFIGIDFASKKRIGSYVTNNLAAG
jgi:hypothetical protein